MLYEMRLIGLAVDPYSNTPIVILKDKVSVETEERLNNGEIPESPTTPFQFDNDQKKLDDSPPPNEFINFESQFTINDLKMEPEEHILPIWIGELEANAIATELLKIVPNRPMTHDLFKNLLSLLGAQLKRIIITDLRDNTFYSTLEIIDAEGNIKSLDARPSDALAIALRCEAPIFVHERVLQKTLQSQNTNTLNDNNAESDSDDENEQKWREHLELLSVDALKKYKQ